MPQLLEILARLSWCKLFRSPALTDSTAKRVERGIWEQLLLCQLERQNCHFWVFGRIAQLVAYTKESEIERNKYFFYLG